MRSAAVAIAGLALVILGAACTTNVARSDDGVIEERGRLSVFDMRVGDCFDDPSNLDDGGVVLDSVQAVPCSEPHDNEVYAVFDVPGPSGASYPGDEEIYFDSVGRCVDRFAGYVGIDYDQSLLVVDPITPTKDSWERDGDREIVCFLYDINLAKLEGSMQGSRQ